jgi:hypothetical protein
MNKLFIFDSFIKSVIVQAYYNQYFLIAIIVLGLIDSIRLESFYF